MATFFMAMTINASARKEHPDISHYVSDSLEVFTKNNIHDVQLFATLGRYDYIAIFEAPDQSVAFKVASEIINRGVLDTETWPVIPYADFSELIG
jgi:uncharacterized protein with GYD domain